MLYLLNSKSNIVNMAKESKEEFYQKLINRLKEHDSFPVLYMFKFIVPADNQKIAQVSQLFPEGAEITMRASKKGNYSSMTIRIVMSTAEEIIEIYKSAEHIEGIMAF